MHRNQEVITTVEQSINDWFSRLPSTNMLQAIQQFNLEGEEDNVRKLLFALFRCQNYSFDSDYAPKNLTIASAFLWLSYLQYIEQFKSVSSHFCVYARVDINYVSRVGRGFRRSNRKIFAYNPPILYCAR
jgi:hypothetical protein